MKILISILSLIFISSNLYAEFPQITQGNITTEDKRLSRPINKSKENELTIASFNVRNLGSRQRSLKDYEQLVDLFDEADVIILQEVGLGVYSKTEVSISERKRVDSIVAIMKTLLNDEFTIVKPPIPSGTGRGIETSLLIYRNNCKGFSISGTWSHYIDIGDKRDLALYKLVLKKDEELNNIYLGSVHLTPDDPLRGNQMIEVSKWMINQSEKKLIVMGDFNWGYRKKSGVRNYFGEEKIIELHNNGKLFQLFNSLSYLGSSSKALRTNLGFRKSGFFYDQFLLSPNLSGLLADGGHLQKDCGIYAFDLSNIMKKRIDYWQKKRASSLKKYMKNSNIKPDESNSIYAKTKKQIMNEAANDATFILSDHRIIWIQLRMW